MVNKIGFTPEQIEYRRAYQRKRYKKLKEEGRLPPDSYSKEKRREYNAAAYQKRKAAVCKNK